MHGGGHAWRGECVWQGGVCMVGGVHGGGACMAGGMHGGGSVCGRGECAW